MRGPIGTLSEHEPAGLRTYAETVARGFYDRPSGGLRGKYDNVRMYWEDRITRTTLRPFVGECDRAARAQGRGVRVLDLGCGAGQGYELLTRIDQKGLSLGDALRFVLAAVLQRLDCSLQAGLGCGHGLIAVLRIGERV